jgi:ABC-type transport system involved in multi-copper enzyme maturation permease subunit
VSEARVMERYRRYTAALADRRTIVWGMGWREFERLVRNRWVLLVIGLAWAQTLLIALIVMPQGFFTPQEIHLRLYGDLTGGGIRIQLVLLAAITGSQLVSRDLSDQSIHLYLARPLTRVDYLLARLLTLLLLFLLAALAPNLYLALAQWTDSGYALGWFGDHRWMLLATVGYGLLVSITFSLLALACSALSGRSGYAAVGFFLAVYFPSFLVETGYGLVQDERILLFSVLHLLDMVGHEMFDAPQWVTVYGFFFRIDLGWRTPLLLLAAIWAATASAVTLRLQRLEVTH